MIKKGKLKKGATLIELSVVLAVLSIISTMVISFSIFFSERVKTTVKANNLMQDVVAVKAVMESWIDDLTQNNATFSCADNNNKLIGDINGTQYSIALENKLLSATLVSGGQISYRVEAISVLTFDVIKNSDQTQTLYICKAFYQADNTVDYFSFTINPYVGDLA